MGYDIIQEDVPTFERRIGDRVLQGSNNTIIIMGTDRANSGPATIDDGILDKGAGTIHIIAGRKAADPDLSADAAYLYLSQKTKADTNLKLTSVEKITDSVSAAILKGDVLREVFRKNIKVSSEDGKKYIFMDDDDIVFKLSLGDKCTVEVKNKSKPQVTITMGSNVIQMDDSKAHIDVSSTKFSLDGSVVKIDSPQVNLVGGCGVEIDQLLQHLSIGLATHTHMTAVGPATPAGLGIGPGDADVQSSFGPAGLTPLYTQWKTKWNPS